MAKISRNEFHRSDCELCKAAQQSLMAKISRNEFHRSDCELCKAAQQSLTAKISRNEFHRSDCELCQGCTAINYGEDFQEQISQKRLRIMLRLKGANDSVVRLLKQFKTGRLQRPITGPRRFRKVKPDLQIRNWKIVRGDSVEVLSGKDKGVVGKVSQVLRGQNKVFVEGLNCHYRYLKPHEEFQGGLVRSEAPLHYSKVALVDPSDGKGTKVGFMFTKDGEKVRVSRRTGTVIPKPPELKLTRIREAYIG
ncbi:uncharacterized protein TRIADDRAFT_54353 [Trichoplax adhaerens]|uniref:Large ribosomal subunit protein uL24m n=1 Tax=Trichoplax adhaerens TaxID=10228 RepID=B3RRT1_TRIAD|nr:hypothetical protein TRIADDRAFT_54353 [Trichoplax adhaerens]EDV26405.1 hypothetical protein TRIADDRAFT_54353 [Trichoplax adhaerens]|eukprot:XP_002110401.1 hypothetical protein TRIADDRAFT_54353 [Trichoplax adhaerens]